LFPVSIPDTLKTEFLDLLTQLSKEGRKIPLSTEQRVQLISFLLNQTVTEFDFKALHHFDVSNFDDDLNEGSLYWNGAFESVWTMLAAACPHLKKVTEWRPVLTEFSEWDMMSYYNKLSSKVFQFSKLVFLETNCFIYSGLYYLFSLNWLHYKCFNYLQTPLTKLPTT